MLKSGTKICNSVDLNAEAVKAVHLIAGSKFACVLVHVMRFLPVVYRAIGVCNKFSSIYIRHTAKS